MAVIEESIVVKVPVQAAYNQWTQFEEFPRFMEGIEQVRQMDNKRLHWKAEVAGKTEEWDAEITEQRPDERVAWKSISGRTNGGAVTFHRLSDAETKLMVQIDYEPEGVVEKVGDAFGVVERRTKADLERFKEFIESRGTETGAWRGEINPDN